MKKKQKGFALVLSLVLLLAMSLMGGALIVIASSDHQGNNSSDEYQQTFYVAETALLQAQKSLIDKILGPIDNSGQRSSNRSIPRNTLSIDPINYGNRSSLTPCYKSFRNLSRAFDGLPPPQKPPCSPEEEAANNCPETPDDPDYFLVEHKENQEFYKLIFPILNNANAIDQIKNNNPSKYNAQGNINKQMHKKALDAEKERLKKFKYEFFSVNSGAALYKGAGTSLKKTSGTTQRQGSAYRIYGCGIMGDVDDPEILIPLETIVILSH